MMFISVRAVLLLGFAISVLPLSSIADESKGNEGSSEVAPAPPAPGQDVSPSETSDKAKAAVESLDEKPPKGGAPAESTVETPPKSLGNSDTSTDQFDLSKLEEKSASIKTIKADLSEALDLAEMLTLRLDALDARTPPQNQTSSPLAVSAQANVADKVHVFIMADNRPVSGQQLNPIARGARANADMMKALLESQCKDARTTNNEDHLAAAGVTVLTDTNFSFQILQQRLNATTVGPNDVLFVYFACHGSTFNDAAKSHFFQTPNPGRNTSEVLSRSEVWRLMKGKGARQTILISDTCSNATSLTPYAISPLTVAAPPTNALSRLLLYQIGDVDISGSSRPPEDNGDGRKNGQFGIYNDNGGFFTIAFLSASLNTPLPVSWKNLFDNAQSRLNAQMAGGVDVNVFGRIVKLNRQTYEVVPD